MKLNKDFLKRASTWANLTSLAAGSFMLVANTHYPLVAVLLSAVIAVCQVVTFKANSSSDES